MEIHGVFGIDGRDMGRLCPDNVPVMSSTGRSWEC